ncbi:MAG: DUF3014 domain-containing protein [Candidatus Binatia bacterium]
MKEFFLWLIPVAALCALVAVYFWPKNEKPQPQTVAAPAPAPEPTIRYPVESADEPAAESLPPLADSDGAIGDALMALFGQKLPRFVNLQNIVHRVVATVDNLPRDHVAPQLMPVKPVTGLPATESVGQGLVLSPRNAARYQPYMRLADAVPTDALVAVYARFYPLFQQQYEDLGYPDKYFNDRAVEVIDHLLATPEVQEPLRLIQPRVLYVFADPKLESLSAGQKIILRIGRANREKLKSKLREIRQALISMPPKK